MKLKNGSGNTVYFKTEFIIGRLEEDDEFDTQNLSFLVIISEDEYRANE